MSGTLAPLNWDAEVKKYDLREITPGVVVYQSKLPPKGTAGCDGPVHYLCPDCFGQHRKSFLQHDPASPYRTCAPCRHEYFWGARTEEAPKQPAPVPTPPALQKGFSRDSLSPAFREALKPRSLEQVIREAVEADQEIQEAADKNQAALRLLAQNASQDRAFAVQGMPQTSPNIVSGPLLDDQAQSLQTGTAAENSTPTLREEAGHSFCDNAPQAAPSHWLEGSTSWQTHPNGRQILSKGRIKDQAYGEYVGGTGPEATAEDRAEHHSAPVHTLETLAELGKELAERAKGTLGPTLRYLGSDYLEAYAAVMEGRAGE